MAEIVYKKYLKLDSDNKKSMIREDTENFKDVEFIGMKRKRG